MKCTWVNSLDYVEYHCYTFDKTKNYTASFDLYSSSSNFILQFFAIDTNDRTNDIIKQTPYEIGMSHKLSATIQSSEINSHNELRVRLITTSSNAVGYSDNWELILS